MNLHAIVRGAISSVNPDRLITWRVNTGYVTDSAGARVPSYTDLTGQSAQIQALSGEDLQHPSLLNVQGVKRAVYMFGNAQGVVRPDAKGGDLLLFPQVLGGADQSWLVVCALETWTPDVAGWCKLAVVLQEP